MKDATPGPGPGQQDGRPPRGALIVVAIGLVACAVAALATLGKGEGEAASLEWVRSRTEPDSRPASLPNGAGRMQLTETAIRATGSNVSGYSLFDVASTLRISAGAPIGGSHVLCAVSVGHDTEIAQSSGGLRATYPRSSEEGIYGQEYPEAVWIDFSAHGSEAAVLEVPHIAKRFTTERGVKLEWPEYAPGRERLDYLIAGKPKHELALPFFTVWKTTVAPAAAISCALTNGAGAVTTVDTRTALARRSPPIDEKAEEERAEEREEAEEKEEAGG